MISTVREFNKTEKADKLNDGLKGARTYFYGAHHYRGLPEFDFDDKVHEDWAWVPKRQMNEYLSSDNYGVFVHALKTR